MTHMIQLTPDIQRSSRWFLDQNVVARKGDDDMGYAWHALLAATFGDLSPAPFRVLEPKGRSLRILGYSSHSASELREHAAAFAEPEAFEALGVADMASKPMPGEFRQGQRFGFEIRTRPTSRRSGEGQETEKDVFLRALDREPERMDHDRSRIYIDWFRDKFVDRGVTLESCAIDTFRLSRTLRRNRSQDRSNLVPVTGPEVIFTGSLVIMDGQRFQEVLTNGLGRHKTFGYGMLLLSPPK